MSTIERTAIYILTLHVPCLFSSAWPLAAILNNYTLWTTAERKKCRLKSNRPFQVSAADPHIFFTPELWITAEIYSREMQSMGSLSCYLAFSSGVTYVTHFASPWNILFAVIHSSGVKKCADQLQKIKPPQFWGPFLETPDIFPGPVSMFSSSFICQLMVIIGANSQRYFMKL